MYFFKQYAELTFWIIALVLLASLNPLPSGSFSLCVLHFLGIPYCPGCGLGRSIAFLFRGDLLSSFNTHPLGLVAVAIIGHRIIQLIHIRFFNLHHFRHLPD